MAGNIGAKHVHAAASVVEKLIRNNAAGVELDAAKESAAVALNTLVSQLRVAFGSQAAEIPAPPTVGAVDPVKSREASARLTALFAECDPSATDFIEANRPVLRPLFTGEAWANLRRWFRTTPSPMRRTGWSRLFKNLLSEDPKPRKRTRRLRLRLAEASVRQLVPRPVGDRARHKGE